MRGDRLKHNILLQLPLTSTTNICDFHSCKDQHFWQKIGSFKGKIISYLCTFKWCVSPIFTPLMLIGIGFSLARHLRQTLMSAWWNMTVQVCYTYSQAFRVSATPPLPFWNYYMSWAQSITMCCTCVNNISCNKPKVVPELEIPAPRSKEWQHGVADIRAAWQRHKYYRDRLYEHLSCTLIGCFLFTLCMFVSF